jgi:hypothetical protein
MVQAPLRWELIGEYLDGNDVASQLDVELPQSDDIEMQHGIAQLEGELLQSFQQDRHQLGLFVDWLLDQIDGPDDDTQMWLDDDRARVVVEL